MKQVKKLIILFFIIIFNNLYSINIKKNYEESYMIELHRWLPETFEDLRAQEENILYKIASENYHYQIDKKNMYNRKELLEIEKLVDIEKLNIYFIKMLNAERSRVNLPKVTFNQNLMKIAKIRANELAHTSKVSHTRPNNTEYWTAFNEIYSSFKNKSSFENALMISIDNEAQMISEKFISETFFNLWKKSPHHFKAMMNKDISSVAVNFALGYSDNKNFLNHINYGIMLGIN